MLNTLMLLVFVELFGADTAQIQCQFPGNDVAEKPIHVVLEPRPSLKDQPGLFRVMMDLNGKLSLKGTAQPIMSTDDRDILIRGITSRKSMYTIGLRDDGAAALNMQTRQAGSDDVTKSTRLGECHGFEAYINLWLPS